jgi:hypothetical protein
MLKQSVAATQSSKFDLKNEFVELVRVNHSAERAFIATDELEAIRTRRRAIPASKHGLETICGASCETGAQ